MLTAPIFPLRAEISAIGITLADAVRFPPRSAMKHGRNPTARHAAHPPMLTLTAKRAARKGVSQECRGDVCSRGLAHSRRQHIPILRRVRLARVGRVAVVGGGPLDDPVEMV